MQSYTFWQLATKYTIEIPIVQRDYAQGRTDKRATSIRNTFLEVLINVLKEEGEETKTLELDFVYGKVENGTFVPIDGQQRLTTLFLLHWYIAAQLKKEEINKINVTYKTRVSARDFCAALIANPINMDEKIEKFSLQIEDASWFFLSWKRDPTVQSMLVMLDAIQDKLKDKKEELDTFWRKLTDLTDSFPNENTQVKKLVECIDCNGNDEIKDKLKEVSKPSAISFKFLNMGEFELNDELYLKMNARGRALSDWENFKAWLIGKAKDIRFKDEYKNWQQLLDQKWTDWFWKNRAMNDKNSFDLAAIQLMKNIAFISYFLNGNNGDDYVYNNFLAKGEETLFLAENYEKCFSSSIHSLNIDNLSSSYEKNSNVLKFTNPLKNYDFICCCFQILTSNHIPSIIWNDNTNDDTNEYLKTILNSGTFESRAYLYAIVQFYNCGMKVSLKDYFRVIRNLVENSTISKDNFHNVLQAIKLLAEDLKSINPDQIKGFDRAQVEEEELKLSLIYPENELNSECRKEILAAENHPFFKGQIRFLFHKDWEKFKDRSNVAKKLFDKDGVSVGKDTNLLGRVLLSVGLDLNNETDDEIWLGGKTTQFWKEHLRESRYIPFILKIIDEIKNPNTSIKHKLNNLIEKNKTNFENTTWKKILINNPRLFSEYSEFGRIIKNWRGINIYQSQKFNENMNAILIENDRNKDIKNLLEKGYELRKGTKWLNGDFYAGDTIVVRKDKMEYSIDKEGKVKKDNSNDQAIPINEFLSK